MGLPPASLHRASSCVGRGRAVYGVTGRGAAPVPPLVDFVSLSGRVPSSCLSPLLGWEPWEAESMPSGAPHWASYSVHAQ